MDPVEQSQEQEVTWGPEPKHFEECTGNECSAGHRWPLAIQLGGCPGCKQGVIGVRQENCPYCNEPSVKLRIRVDHLPSRGGQFVGACQGGSAPWGIHAVMIEREPWWEKDGKELVAPEEPKNDA
jgi:hypothetical protein